MSILKTGKSPTARRKPSESAMWYTHGNWPVNEWHLTKLADIGLMGVDEDWLDNMPQVASIRLVNDGGVLSILPKPPKP